MSVLTIYTNSFPYGNAETFLESEIPILSLHFSNVYIVPFREDGVPRNVPGNVLILSSVQDKKWHLLKMYLVGLISWYLILEIPEIRNELKRISIFKALKYLGFAALTKNRLSKIIPAESSVHYSYWLNFSAFSLALLKREGRIKILISRAHGFDLYEERGEKSLTFIKAATLKYLDRLFLISDHGRNYLIGKFPDFSDKYYLSRLGTSDPEFTNLSQGNSGLTLVSCSAINPNKRVNLILDSLILFSTRFPSVNVKWYHLGSGSDMVEYVEKANSSLKNSSVQCFLPGQLTHSEIINFYKSMPVDLFLTVSANEGIPVSIMEAQSFGIPVIATAVGGIPEIVNETNGLLLSANPSPLEIAEAIYEAFIEKEKWEKKRLYSRRNWEENFNAEKNYNAYAVELLSLV
jgi:glycosyltransferase involved in cell wall biosynthesis